MAHILIWIHNAPHYGVDSDDDVCHFIDRYVTCTSLTNDDALKELVQAVQVHKHSSTCKRLKRCRFHYPKLPNE